MVTMSPWLHCVRNGRASVASAIPFEECEPHRRGAPQPTARPAANGRPSPAEATMMCPPLAHWQRSTPASRKLVWLGLTEAP